MGVAAHVQLWIELDTEAEKVDSSGVEF